VSAFGKLLIFNVEQRLNALGPIYVILLKSKVTSKLEHPEKQSFSMLVQDVGILIVAKLLQSKKTWFLI
jgi:hypothetical protein